MLKTYHKTMKNTYVKCLLKFYSTSKVFHCFKKWYKENQIKLLNNFVKCQGQLRYAKSLIKYLKSCIHYRVIPNWLTKRIKSTGARITPNVEKAFLNDEIEMKRSKVDICTKTYQSLWSKICDYMNVHDMIRLCLHISKIW